MKKAIIITCLVLSALMILDQSGVLNSLFVFLLVGALPGTEYNVPPMIMLLLLVCCMWLVIFRVIGIETFFSPSTKKTKKQGSRKKQMPKRRFSEV